MALKPLFPASMTPPPQLALAYRFYFQDTEYRRAQVELILNSLGWCLSPSRVLWYKQTHATAREEFIPLNFQMHIEKIRGVGYEIFRLYEDKDRASFTIGPYAT